MKVLIDTNVLVSAVLFPQGLTRRALAQAIEGQDDAMVCDYSLDELCDVFARKFPDDASLLPQFMNYLSRGVRIVRAPGTATEQEVRLRDPKDQPILRAAIDSQADVILTGDRDFLDTELGHPYALSPRDYLNHLVDN